MSRTIIFIHPCHHPLVGTDRIEISGPGEERDEADIPKEWLQGAIAEKFVRYKPEPEPRPVAVSAETNPLPVGSITPVSESNTVPNGLNAASAADPVPPEVASPADPAAVPAASPEPALNPTVEPAAPAVA